MGEHGRETRGAYLSQVTETGDTLRQLLGNLNELEFGIAIDLHNDFTLLLSGHLRISQASVIVGELSGRCRESLRASQAALSILQLLCNFYFELASVRSGNRPTQAGCFALFCGPDWRIILAILIGAWVRLSNGLTHVKGTQFLPAADPGAEPVQIQVHNGGRIKRQ